LSQEDLRLEKLVEEYAEAKGIDKEEAKKRLLPILRREPDRYEQIKKELGLVEDVFTTYQTIAEKAPEPMKTLASTLAGEHLAKLKTEDDPIEETMAKIKKHLLEIKLMDIAAKAVFGEEKKEEKPKTEEISEALKPFLEEFKELKEYVEGKKRDEVQQILNEIKEIVASRSQPAGEENPKEIVDKAKKVLDDIKDLASAWGYKLEKDYLTKDEIEQILKERQEKILEELAEKPERIKEILEAKGYKIVGGPIPYDQVQKMLEEERKRILEQVHDDIKIRELGEIIRESVKEVIGLFRPMVGTWFEKSLEERASGGEGESTEQPSSSEEGSQQQ